MGKIRVENSAVLQRKSMVFARERIRMGSERELFYFLCENERKRSIRYERLRIITIGFFAVTEICVA